MIFCLHECKGCIGKAVEQGERLCDYVNTVRVFTYFGDRVGVGGECEVAVTVSTRCVWVTFRECGGAGHVLRRALDCEVNGERRKERPKSIMMKQVEEVATEANSKQINAPL